MKKIFWGFLLMFLSFDLDLNGHSLDVLPDFVGYILLLQGMRELEHESDMFKNARPFAVGMTIYTAVLWVGQLLAVHAGNGWITELLEIASTVVALYISWMLIQGVTEMEHSREADLHMADAYQRWKELAGVQVAVRVLSLLANLANISIILIIVAALAIAALVLNILYLVAWWKGVKAYEQLETQPIEE